MTSLPVHFCTTMSKCYPNGLSPTRSIDESATAIPHAEGGLPEVSFAIQKVWQRAAGPLRVGFMAATVTPRTRQIVQTHAPKWCPADSWLKLAFVDGGPCDILVDFKRGAGFWSYIGRDSLQFAQNGQASMNLDLHDQMTAEEAQEVVLHEFGHAIGAIHEHQIPNSGIVWNKNVVYAEMRRQNWTDQDTDFNIINVERGDLLNQGPFDRTSIMMYQIPAGWATRNGVAFIQPSNTTLSEEDLARTKQVYPLIPPTKAIEDRSLADQKLAEA